MTRGQPVTRWSLHVVVLAAAMVAATTLGAWWASTAVARHDPRSLRVGRATFSVTQVERVTGLTEADLGGMSHGIQGLVNEDQMLIRVSLTVSTGGSAATYDPRLLQVYGAGPVGVAPLGGSLGRGRLSPHGRLEGSLSYVVPRDGAQLVLRSEGTSDAVPLLRADRAPAGAGKNAHTSGTHP